MSVATIPAERASGGGTSCAPRHVAIIMDGNGRWAKQRFMPRIFGHKAGVEAVRRVVKAAPGFGIEYLTLYAFSSENWKRPEDEVRDLSLLLKHYLHSEIAELDRNNVRIRFIGDYKRFGPDIADLADRAALQTAKNNGLNLVVALNYGARDEIARAARQIAEAAVRGEVDPGRIDADLLARHLDTGDIPDPDLVIRTSGEVRLSNFLLWQAAYAELYFTDAFWPDFDATALADAVESYRQRDRRYGGVRG